MADKPVRVQLSRKSPAVDPEVVQLLRSCRRGDPIAEPLDGVMVRALAAAVEHVGRLLDREGA